MNDISASEKKRLESLKQKKESFRAKEQAVQNALKNLNNTKNKNKIIFDESIDVVETTKLKSKGKKRKKDLFDSDNEGDEDEKEPNWDDSNSKIKQYAAEQLVTRNVTLGNDERFKLDDRFIEDDAEEEEANETPNDTSDLQKEKEWQLDILRDVLGVPVFPKKVDVDKDTKFTKKGMVRYDPTENGHKEYEIIPEKPEPDNKKSKKKKKKVKEITEDVVENAPVEVSNDIYFSVSESLKQNFNETGQFSLLKTLGREEPVKNGILDNDTPDTKSTKNVKFSRTFDTKNPFKFDSSDSENENTEIRSENLKTNKDTYNSEEIANLFNKTDKFFFDTNDTRFDEAVKFFSKEPVSVDEFKNLRRELKQIVRSKIRKNIKKSELWGNKRKPRKLS